MRRVQFFPSELLLGWRYRTPKQWFKQAEIVSEAKNVPLMYPPPRTLTS